MKYLLNSALQLPDTSQSIKPLAGRKAVIIIPESVSYFYNTEGQRIADSFERLGGDVVVCGIRSVPQEFYDWCFLMNLCEIITAHNGNSDFVIEQIYRLKLQCTHVALVLMESVRMTWFDNNFHYYKLAGLDILIDIGFYDQKCHLTYQNESLFPEAEQSYYFVFNGLTYGERLTAERANTPARDRPIPWAYIGHQVEARIRFLDQLLNRVSKDGVVYLPFFTPVTEDGPHMNEQQFYKVLERTRFKIWCAHVSHFYLESIRFRQALLTGSLPIKVNIHPCDIDAEYPFSDLVLEQENFDEHLSEIDFESTREKFREEFFSYPKFENELLRVIELF